MLEESISEYKVAKCIVLKEILKIKWHKQWKNYQAA